ncbi:MAG: hypothetical protein HYU66_23925 [Armatimonadetes bacterium]|nr:hypothetical protein [Armatimonadota bacterium]
MEISYGLLRTARVPWSAVAAVHVFASWAIVITPFGAHRITAGLHRWLEAARHTALRSRLPDLAPPATEGPPESTVAAALHLDPGQVIVASLAWRWSPLLIVAWAVAAALPRALDAPYRGLALESAETVGLLLLFAVPFAIFASWDRQVSLTPEALTLRQRVGAIAVAWPDLHAVVRCRRGWRVYTTDVDFLLPRSPSGARVAAALKQVAALAAASQPVGGDC